MSDRRDEPENELETARERLRLLEFQLDYLRAELLHLTHERYWNVYSASWLIFKPLRAVEARLVDTAIGLWRRVKALAPARPFAQAPHPNPLPVNGERERALVPAKRLLIDVTGTIKLDAGTGIQRVVKEVARALYSGEAFEIPALVVRCQGGRLYTCHEFVASLGRVAPAAPDTEVAIEPGDRLLMLSDSWNAFDELAGVFAVIRARGGEVISCIFDLIPELYPHACHEVTVPRYDAWLRKGLLESDSFIAISRTVADELADFVETHGYPRRAGLKIGWFHCGSDLADSGVGEPREKIRAAAAGKAPVFLDVGTIEPRKGHRVALRAFERLWGKGVDARLIFVGRRGWFEEAICSEILGHGEFGRRLFWFDDVGDAELSFLYDNARALVFPSYAEGFGLPIVEAARRGRPVLCSDIPVFREIGRDGAAYFPVNDSEALAELVKDFLAGRVATDPSRVLQSSWADAARRIVSVIAKEDWSRRLP